MGLLMLFVGGHLRFHLRRARKYGAVRPTTIKPKTTEETRESPQTARIFSGEGANQFDCDFFFVSA